ncbi:MAG: TraM recognition domain-containing protein [Henriciella sp.]
MAERRPDQTPMGALLSGGLAALCAYGWHHFKGPETEGISLVLGILALFLAMKFLGSLAQRGEDIHKRARALRKTSAHGGTASLMTKKEARAEGLLKGDGVIVGTLENEVVRDSDSVHGVWIMPTGSGKTTGPLLVNACDCLTNGRWDVVIMNDPKPEAAPMMRTFCEKNNIGYFPINASGRFEDLIGPSAAWNPMQVGIDVAERGQPSLLEHCDSTNELLIQIDRTGSDKNIWWKRGGIRRMTTPQAYWALTDPDRCNHTETLKVLEDPLEYIKLMDKIAASEDLLQGDLSRRAKSIIAMATADPKNNGNMMDEAVTVAQMFAASGSIGNVSNKTSITFDKPCLITLSSDMTLIGSQSQFASLVMVSLMRWSVRQEKPLRVKILYDEAAFSPMQGGGLNDLLVIARGLGCSVEIFFQTVGDAKRILGEDGYNAMMGNCERKVYGGLHDQAGAEAASEAVGETGVLKESFSRQGGDFVQSYAHETRRIATGDEIRRLPKGKILVMIGNKKPLIVDHLSISEVADWKDQVRHSPWHDSPLKMKTRVRIR